MDAAGIKPEDIKSVDDLIKLPFTTKQDLRDNYPYGMNAVPMSDVVRYTHLREQAASRPLLRIHSVTLMSGRNVSQEFLPARYNKG